MAPLNHALRNTGEAYRVDAHQPSHAVEYQTAQCDLLELEELGLLEKTRQGNAFPFFTPTDLRERLAGLAGMPARAAARRAGRAAYWWRNVCVQRLADRSLPARTRRSSRLR